MDEKKEKRGRPSNLSIEEKKEIVKRFMDYKANNDFAVLRAYNIYKKLAEFANEYGYLNKAGKPLKAKDFSSEDVKRFIDDLATQLQNERYANVIEPVFVPLDIEKILTGPRREVARILREKNTYYMNVCLNAERILEHSRTLQKLLNDAYKDLADHEQKCKGFEAEVAELKKELVLAQRGHKSSKLEQKRAAKNQLLTFLDLLPDRVEKKTQVLNLVQIPLVHYVTDSGANETEEDRDDYFIDFKEFGKYE